jgi:hypothetical protein
LLEVERPSSLLGGWVGKLAGSRSTKNSSVKLADELRTTLQRTFLARCSESVDMSDVTATVSGIVDASTWDQRVARIRPISGHFAGRRRGRLVETIVQWCPHPAQHNFVTANGAVVPLARRQSRRSVACAAEPCQRYACGSDPSAAGDAVHGADEPTAVAAELPLAPGVLLQVPLHVGPRDGVLHVAAVFVLVLVRHGYRLPFSLPPWNRLASRSLSGVRRSGLTPTARSRTHLRVATRGDSHRQ